MDQMQWQINKYKRTGNFQSSIATLENMRQAMNYHRTIPGYDPTPLVQMKSLSAYLGIGKIWIKDESCRFGLNSFKGLGSSYAIAEYLAKEYGFHLTSFNQLLEKLKSVPSRTFASATAGNHGRGLAWAAKQLGQNAAIFLPKGSSEYRLSKVRELGVQAEITDLNYDDTVRQVSKLSKANEWIIVQDTSWDGYEEIPALIMQGYLTILGEILEQLKAAGEVGPTHVILQAGVGSFAGAIAGVLRQLYKQLQIIIVEPTQADCFFQSALAEDGLPAKASGDLSSMMAGLSCGELNPAAWNILKNIADVFAVCPDSVAAKGMRILGNPMGNDERILSGESGALPIGFLAEICTRSSLKGLKEYAGFNSDSRVLVINTEGITDPQNYWSVCWDGKNNKIEG